MIVHLGPFHPHLEDTLVHELVAAKSKDPWAALLVLVPSDAIRRRLAWLLAGERRLAFLNLHIVTFHQLARRLDAEASTGVDATLQDDGAFEELVRYLLSVRAYGEIFAGLEDTPGGCGALWQTLRDLKDARVDPATALDAVRSGLFGADSAQHLHALFALYRDVLATAQTAEWHDYTDLDVAAVEHVPRSTFLSSFARVFHYGFYDLTQAQYDLFRAVARRCETTLFFPLIPNHPGWAFADRFYRRYIVGLATGEAVHHTAGTTALVDRLFNEDASTLPPEENRIAVWTCCGARDEVRATAKEILRLVEEEKFAFADIGVVARGLDVYGAAVAHEFVLHAIPFVSTAKMPLAQCPLAHAVGHLSSIASGRPSRENVIDLLTSPYFRFESRLGEEPPCPDLWDAISRRAGISDGFAAWARLDRLLTDSDQDGASAPSSLGQQAAILRRLVSDLENRCSALPVEASYSEHAAAWKTVLERMLGLVTMSQTDDPAGAAVEVRQAIALVAAIDQSSALDAIRPRVTREQFLQSVRRRIDAADLMLDAPNANGVSVLDAMAARAMPFRAMFILGVNEGVFPRVIREDAFLRDRDRRVLETDLGYKMPEKFAGYDEERLLFSLLVGAGLERLYLIAQRSDETGRVLAPSWYRDELYRAAGIGETGRRERSVPRRSRDKFQTAPFDRLTYLTPYEAALSAAFDSGDPVPFLDSESSRSILTRSHNALAMIEDAHVGLGVFDGWVGPLPWLQADIYRERLSATALEMYARCPTQFFLRRALGVVPVPVSQDGVVPAVRGRLCHEILAQIFRVGVRVEPRAVSLARLDDVCDAVFSEYARTEPTGYPLEWELETRRIRILLREVMSRELNELESSGFVPVTTEAHIDGMLPIGEGVPIQGRLDRIDRHPDGRARIIDYKVTVGRLTRPFAPVKDAIQARRLQPPLYAVLGRQYLEHSDGPSSSRLTIEVSLHVLTPQQDNPLVRRRYEPSTEAQARISRTLATLIDGIEQGRFAMIPEEHCSWCEVSRACRRRHWPSRQRASDDVRAQPIIALRRAALTQTAVES